MARYQYDQLLFMAWGLGCLAGAVALLLMGARAAGLALLGSIVGALVGFLAVSNTFDLLPYGAIFGATAGTIVFGLAGLLWRPSASASTLTDLATITAVGAVVAILRIHVFADQTCHVFGPRGQPCLRLWDPFTQALLALNAAFLVLTLLVQARQASKRTALSQGNPLEA